MEILLPGHLYLLANLEEGGQTQTLQFIHKEKVGEEFQTITNGTTTEEVLLVLIDRLNLQNKKAPHPDNETAIECLRTSLAALNHRTEERKARGVLDTPKV